jgi:hypothetical protein
MLVDATQLDRWWRGRDGTVSRSGGVFGSHPKTALWAADQ